MDDEKQQQPANSSTISNKIEYGLNSLRQPHSYRGSPTGQLQNAHHHSSIISLSKIKNYIPQSKVAAHLFRLPGSPVRHPSVSKGIVNSLASAGCYEAGVRVLDQSNPSSYYQNNNNGNHGKLARAKTLGFDWQLSNNSRVATERGNPPPQGSSLFNQTSGNQVVVKKQQEQQHHHHQQLGCEFITDRNRRSSVATADSKGEESEEAEEVASELKDQQPVIIGEERKQKKIDTRERNKSTTVEGDNNTSSNTQEAVVGAQRSSYIRNNMTPSSLLLLQNHNYIEQHQQQRAIAQYSDCNQAQQERGDVSLAVGQTRTSIANSCSERGTPGIAAKLSDEQHQSQSHSTNPAQSSSSSSSSSHMLNNINQFRTSDGIGNSSITNSANTQTSVPSANLVETSDYSTRQGPSQIHNQLTEADSLASSNSIHNLQQNYHQSLSTCDFKANANNGSAQFVHYNAQTNRVSATNSYHENFQAAHMLEQQMKIENVVNTRNIFEGTSSIGGVEHDNHQETGSVNIGPLNVARDLARQQVRTSINNYYSSHYNLMPTNSSKSASPISSTSTPSPKTNAMHQTTSQHQNQLVLTGSHPSSQIHLDHLNHHYMGSNATVGGLNQQQLQANQHYSYNQTVAATSQHHLAIPAHDQGYAHQQSQQQQQQQHQHHQVQQHQQSQQLQQHQHQSVANQQSIYHQLANNAASVNHIYCNTGSGTHYQGHLQSSTGVHPQNHLISGAHQSHLNTAVAAQAAAAVVSQTLKTVVNQQNQQHPYGNSIPNSFGQTSGSLMNMTAQHHSQFHAVNHHHLTNQAQVAQQSHQQQQSLPVHHTASIVSRKYQCKMCPQVFMSKAELKYHNQNHMREAKPYKCLQCPKAFANSSYLSQHMRIHQGVKPYICDICSRRFTQLSHLQQHKRTHTGDKPYKCNYMNCTKQFSQLSNLQSHSRCHQLDKPYKCNSCYKCFHDEQSLLEHIPRHLESKHLKKNLCIFCGSSYQQERGLVKHFQQYHTDKSPTLVTAAIAAGTTGNTTLIASLVSSTTASAFATPSSGGGSSSSSSSSISSSGSLNVHTNNINVAHGTSAAFGTNHY